MVILYLQKVSEKIDLALKKHHIASLMKPYTTIRSLLVHHNGKCEVAEQEELVYNIPSKNCENVYIVETRRLFKSMLVEHKRDVENMPQEIYLHKKYQETLWKHD